ncbi:hypothetical protein TNCV_2656291 [Trichonephila clavipes]|nr:hypothetical protein TNCV_2656291 [Trichonephila clavipes]
MQVLAIWFHRNGRPEQPEAASVSPPTRPCLVMDLRSRCAVLLCTYADQEHEIWNTFFARRNGLHFEQMSCFIKSSTLFGKGALLKFVSGQLGDVETDYGRMLQLIL